MGKNRRSRRPGGHPAKVAQRRERDGGNDARAAAPGPYRMARPIVREALELTDALDAEVWASCLLGVFRSQRDALPANKIGPGIDLVVAGPLIEAIRRIGGTGARIALSVIASVDEGELGLRANALAEELSVDTNEPFPDWVAELGQAEITGAAVMREDVFDDACTMFLEARHPNGGVHALGVVIDNNLGGMATDVLLLAESLERVEQIVRDRARPDREVTLERMAPGIAAGRIHAAVELTDMTWNPAVSEDYLDLRALAVRRGDETPGYVPATESPEISRAERDALMEEFLDSPDAEGFAADGEEAYAVSLAIDFCADYVDGRPLRWSPEVVELFMADWIPRKVLGDAELFAALPAALDAWVRFAGRKSALPPTAIALTRDAIPRWHATMIRRSDDPAAGGPTKLLTAARQAGIDLEDKQALDTFVAGWNARSEVG